MNADALPRVKPFSATPFDTAEGPGFWCVRVEGCSPLKVTQPIVDLLETLNDHRSLDELLRTLAARQVDASEQEVLETLERLAEWGLLEETDAPPPPSVLWLKFRLLDGRFLMSALRPLAFLFHPRVMVLVFALTLAATVWFLTSLTMPAPLTWKNGSIIAFVLVYLALIGHELGHVAAASRFGVAVPDMGIGMYILRPVLYCNLTEAWRLGRWNRVIINLAGIYFQMIFATGLILIHFLRPSPVLSMTIQMTVMSALFNLNPTLRYDGFWVLGDAMGLNNVHGRTAATVKMLVMKLFGRKGRSDYDWSHLPPAVRNLYITYVVVYASAITVAVGGILWILTVWLLGLRKVGLGDLSFLITIAASIFLQFFLSLTKQFWRNFPRLGQGRKRSDP